MKIYFKSIWSDGHSYCVYDSREKVVIDRCKQLVAEEDYYYEADMEPEVEVREISVSKNGMLAAMHLGALLAGNSDTLVSVSETELRASLLRQINAAKETLVQRDKDAKLIAERRKLKLLREKEAFRREE